MDYKLIIAIFVLFYTIYLKLKSSDTDSKSNTNEETFNNQIIYDTDCTSEVTVLTPEKYFYRTSDLDSIGPKQISVYPLSGDPDLYISFNDSQPKFTLKNYDYSSYSCGKDEILLSSAIVPTILHIGVYCSSIITNCEFNLTICHSVPIEKPVFVSIAHDFIHFMSRILLREILSVW